MIAIPIEPTSLACISLLLENWPQSPPFDYGGYLPCSGRLCQDYRRTDWSVSSTTLNSSPGGETTTTQPGLVDNFNPYPTTNMGNIDSETKRPNQGSDGSITLAQDLESTAWTRFDDMVSSGKITYKDTTGETLEDEGFKFEVRLAPALQKKPITKADAPERKTGKGKNPFLDPNPDEILSPVGPDHLLLLNIYAFYRPSLLITTRDYHPQEEALNDGDLTAAWAVLDNFPRERYFLIYNCGYNSGSSQGHKHMQLWPYPNERELGFELFPSMARSETAIAKDIVNVPLKHFVLRLPPHATTANVIQAHRRLLQEVRHIQQQTGSGTAHNVIITKDWICLVPRRHSGFERGVGINSAGVLGLAWAVSEEEKNAWISNGAADLLRYVGIPIGA